MRLQLAQPGRRHPCARQASYTQAAAALSPPPTPTTSKTLFLIPTTPNKQTSLNPPASRLKVDTIHGAAAGRDTEWVVSAASHLPSNVDSLDCGLAHEEIGGHQEPSMPVHSGMQLEPGLWCTSCMLRLLSLGLVGNMG